MPDAAAEPFAPPAFVATIGIPHARIHPSAINPRKHFDDEADKAFAATIAVEGVLQPISVRPHPTIANEYEIVMGERRWRAVGANIRSKAMPADYEIPATVRPLTDQQVRKLAIIENLQREDLTEMEEAEAFAALVADGMTPPHIATALGKSPRFVQQRLDLIKRTHPDVQKAMREGKLTAGQARPLTRAPHDKQTSVLTQILSGGLKSTEEIERACKATLIPVTAAWFDLKLYTGELQNHPDTEAPCFMDTAQFERLQKEFMDNKRASLLLKHKWVEIVPTFVGGTDRLPHNYEQAAKGTEKAGAVIVVEQEAWNSERRSPPKFKVFEGVIDKGNPARGGVSAAQAAAKAAGKGPSSAAGANQSRPRHDAEPFDQHAFYSYGDRVRDQAMQLALLADPTHVLRLLCLEIVTGGAGCVLNLQPGALPNAPAVVPALQERLRQAAAPLGDDSDPHAVWKKLLKLDRGALDKLLVTLLVSRAQVIDDELHLFIATDIKADQQLRHAWKGTDDEWIRFLGLCSGEHLRGIAADFQELKAMGPIASADNKPDRLRKLIYDAVRGRRKEIGGYRPLELAHFFAEGDYDRAIKKAEERRHLAIDNPAKAPPKGKSKPASKATKSLARAANEAALKKIKKPAKKPAKKTAKKKR